MADNVDVLAVLDDIWKRGLCVNNVTAFDGARSRIAELITADLEYDAAEVAWDALDNREPGDEDTRDYDGPEFLRFMQAIKRRAAALSACTGGSDE